MHIKFLTPCPLKVLLDDPLLRVHLVQEAGGPQAADLRDEVDKGGTDVLGQTVAELVSPG